jgi:hypothetical protein
MFRNEIREIFETDAFQDAISLGVTVAHHFHSCPVMAVKNNMTGFIPNLVSRVFKIIVPSHKCRYFE